MKPKIYLDMDGVISNFMKSYYNVEYNIDTPKKFHGLVRDHQIFEHLEKMPNADKLLNLLFTDLDVDVEILSSLGTWTEDIAAMGAAQKSVWLDKHGIFTPRNFVNSWALKYKCASPTSIMIDDRPDVIEEFKVAGGLGVQYIADEWTNMEKQIRMAVASVNQKLELMKNANLYV